MKMSRPVNALAVMVALALVASGCAAKADSPTAATGGPQAANGAFRVDVSKCPSDATKALAAGEDIKIGTVLPLSGPASVIGTPIGQGMKIYFDKVNAQGGVVGHKVAFVTKDDGYDPTKTIPQLTELLQKDKVFATVGQAGTPNVAAGGPLAEQTCTPQLWATSGAPQFSDPGHHPWTVGGFMSYTTEAQAWADFIKREKPGARVAYLEISNAAGEAYANGFTPAATANGLTIVASAKTSATATSVQNEVTNLLTAKPDVVIVMSIAASCANTLGALAQGGYKGMTIAAYSCAPAQIFPALGAVANGAVALSINKDLKTNADDPDIKQFSADAATYAAGVKVDDSTLGGYRLADLMVKNLKAAAQLDGGLTRANLMNAAWSLDTTWFAGWGGQARVDGTKDSYVLEYGQMLRWDGAKGVFVPAGAPIDREGKTGTYEG